MGKYKLVFLMLVLFITAAFFLTLRNSRNKPSVIRTGVSQREVAIQQLFAQTGDGWKNISVSFDDLDNRYVVIGYNYDSKFLNHPEETARDLATRGGVIVYRFTGNRLEQVWESRENMGGAGVPRIRVQDVNANGIKELLVEFPQGANPPTSNLYVYKKENEIFKIISPLETASGGQIVSQLYGLTPIEVRDLDNDKIAEIILTNVGDIKSDTDGEIPYPHTKTKTIFKWNGATYELWKEETGNQ